MPFNLKDYLKDFYYSLFRSQGTPASLSVKRVFLLCFLFIVFPVWNLYIRLGCALDRLFYPGFKKIDPAPVFIIGNYRSGSTFFHRLLLRDPQFTCLKAWEIYFAPSLVHRKVLRGVLRISKIVGSPVQRFVRAFDRLMNDIYPMHKTGLSTYEQDSQLFYHTWSSFNLFAIFPFPDLVRKYIYYDQLVPEQDRKAHFGFYRDVLKRKLYLNPGKIYLSKNPDFTPAVQTLLEVFPEARIINLVRQPQGMIPSSINLWSSNWKGYGTPPDPYPLQDVVKEYARHWYAYPQQTLADLPSDRYNVVYFERLVADPKEEIERIYRQLGLKITADFLEILEAETAKSRDYISVKNYSLEDLGLDADQIREEFAPVYEPYRVTLPIREKTLEGC
jgi:hypothetical protein